MQGLTGCRNSTGVMTRSRPAACRRGNNPAGRHIAEQQPVHAPVGRQCCHHNSSHMQQQARHASRRCCLQHRHRPPTLQQVISHLLVESPQLFPVLQRGGLAGALPQDEVLQRLQLETPPENALHRQHVHLSTDHRHSLTSLILQKSNSLQHFRYDQLSGLQQA